MSTGSNSNSNIISSNIDIAQNEYVTKYSFNRNFQKLLSNDVILDNISQTDIHIETYNKYKTYNINDIVFYKISPDNSTLYVLCSIIENNNHMPLVVKDDYTNNYYIVSSEYWQPIGAIDYNNTKMMPIDIANNYISHSSKSFIEQHQNNTSLSAHPSGKLGIKDSNILFKTFNNIQENKSHFYYPYELQSFIANNSIYSGYMRKWDNGLLEYDIVFKLGVVGKTSDGLTLISANNYYALNQNNNFMYFKDEADYGIFSKGGDYYINVNGTKQVNLNNTINSYSTQINFIEPFKDLNYMIFTSNVKNVETESYNTNIELIENYDKRLKLNNNIIIGLQDNATFRIPLIIPNEVVNIKYQAMSNMKKSQGYSIPLIIDPNESNLINIDNDAFVFSELDTISLPYSLRYIGKNAFADCEQLTSIILYVERDPNNQPKIDYNAFYNTNIKEISVIYRQEESPILFETSSELNETYKQIYLSEEHISEKLQNNNYRTNIGIINEPILCVYNSPSLQPTIMSVKYQPINNDLSNSNEKQKLTNLSTDIITIDVNEFLAELSAMNTSKLNKSTLFKANVPIEPTINNIFNFIDLEDDKRAITGFNNIILDDEIKINLDDDSTITQISSNALANFNKLTSLSIGSNITSIATDAFGYEFNELVLSTDKSFTFNTSFNTICVLNSSCKLSVNSVNNYYYVQNNAIIPTQSISASYIKNLYVNNIKEIQTSAFVNIEGIDNVYLFSNNENAIICSEAFHNEYITDDGEPYYDTNFSNLQLNGYNWTIQPSALIGIEVDYLSINMLNSHINQNAFYSGFIGTLMLSNNSYGDVDNGYRGLYSQSLNNTYINNLTFPDINANVSTLNNVIRSDGITISSALNNINISQPIIITTSCDSQIFFNNKLCNIINYLGIDFTTKTLSSIKNITNDFNDTILIPNYISAIGSNIANNNSNVIHNVYEIYVPKSVKHINDNAFEGLSNLEYIQFEQGIQLEYIGETIFKGCSSLEDVKFQ